MILLKIIRLGKNGHFLDDHFFAGAGGGREEPHCCSGSVASHPQVWFFPTTIPHPGPTVRRNTIEKPHLRNSSVVLPHHLPHPPTHTSWGTTVDKPHLWIHVDLGTRKFPWHATSIQLINVTLYRIWITCSQDEFVTGENNQNLFFF